ncbi:MAG: 30S ribosomal protein S5 [bacterium]|nr:30S ribosomal protein S5 [bacterium]
MEEEKKPQENIQPEAVPKTEAKVKAAVSVMADSRMGGRGGDRGGDRKRNFKGKRGGPGRGRNDGGLPEEFEQKMIDIARVTRVMAGGKRMRFRACVAIGNKKGRVAIGLAKGADVTGAVTKAVNKAKKDFIDVPIVNETIPHEIYQKLGAAKILFKPANKGRGIIAGGAVRIVLELTGIKNVSSKILGTNNKVNNVKCTIAALKNLKRGEVKKSKEEKENKAVSNN